MPALPYQNVHVVAYRGLQRLGLEDCGPVNLLVGENNCGKTSVLEAIWLLGDPMNIARWDAAVALRGAWPFADARFQGGAIDRLSGIFWLFPHLAGERAAIELSADGAAPLRALVATVQSILGVPPARPELSETAEVEGGSVPRQTSLFGGELEIPGAAVDLALQWAETDTGAAQPATFRMVLWGENSNFVRARLERRSPRSQPRFATPISHRSDGYLGQLVSGLIRKQKRDRVLELLSKVDRAIEDLLMLSPVEPDGEASAFPKGGQRATLHVRHSALGLVPIHALGDGVRRAIHLAALIVEAGEGGVLLIDEIEVGMHTSVLRDVMGWLAGACRETGVQLFATTHSLEAVDAAIASIPTADLGLYRLKGGQARRIGGDLLRSTRFDFGHEVR